MNTRNGVMKCNLELWHSGSHTRHHQLERLATPEGRARNRKALDIARPLARAWHGSAEGIEWHKKHGKRTWSVRVPVVKTCIRCGKEFQTFWGGRAKYCSRRCSLSAAYHSRRFFTEAHVCAWCGRDFMANRHDPARCCSRLCSNRKRVFDARLQSDAGSG